MAKVSTYFNFPGTTEAAFNFYKSVFRTEFVGQIARMGDFPATEGQPPMADDVKNLIMNIQLPITGGHLIMGTDAVEGMGFNMVAGNNVYVSVHPDSREEADRLYNELSAGGDAQMPMADQFWGDYFGSLVDKFGTHWMVNYSTNV